MPLLNLDVGHLYYEDKGEGQPLLFVHAGVADSSMWDEQVETFAQAYRVVRCDLRGFGRSPYPDGAFAYHEDLQALCEHLHLETICLIGASFGGRVVVDFYLSFPQKVSGMVLISPVVSGFQPSEAVRSFGKREDELLEAGKLDEAVALNLTMWVEGAKRSQEDVDPELRARVGDMQLKAFKMPYTDNTAIKTIDPPAINRLREIGVPLLVVNGDLDEASFINLGKDIVEQVVSAKGILVPEVAHLVSMEEPDLFKQLLVDFLADLGAK